MTARADDTRSLLWPALLVALVLAALTGFVDAVAFDRFLRVFPANQSGNAVFLGTAIGGSSVVGGWQSGTSMAGFALGIVAGELLRRRVRGPRVGAWLLLFELALVVVTIAITGPIDGVHILDGAESYVVIVLVSMAMGVQTTVIRHVAGTAVATTYQTGAIARMGQALTRVASREGRLREERGLGVLLAVLTTYIGGAALGAAAPGEWRWAMVLAAATLAIVALAWFVAPSVIMGAGD